MERENDKKGLIVLVIVLSLLVVGLSSYLIYDKVFEKNNEEKVENNKEENNNIEIISGKFGQILNSGIGKIIVDKTGLVYYIPEKSWINFGMEYKLNFTDEDKNKLGKYGEYQVEIDMYPGNDTKDSIEAYKLNLSNIRSAYEVEFGNGGTVISIIFIDNDGKVNELQFFAVSSELFEVNLYRNVGEYENIVSVVPTSSYGGNSAILIDKDGNEYEYARAIHE